MAVAREKLTLLEVGRAAAAIAVVLYHAAQAGDSFTSGRLYPAFGWGLYGVDFFFVLSGFIIFHVHRDDPRDSSAAKRFLSKRLRRIYVPYLPVGLGMCGIYLSVPDLSLGTPEWSLFTSLTLLPWGPPALSVAWTLVYEMTFYLFFLLFYATRYFWALAAGWCAAIVMAFAIGGLVPPDGVLAHYADPIILEFFVGMAAAYLVRRAPLSYWLPALLLGATLVALFFVIGGLPRFAFGVALGPLVLSLALLELRHRPRVPEVLLLLGTASYAIYLVHHPLFKVIGRAMHPWDSWGLTFATCVVGGVAAGVSYHIVYERRALGLLSNVTPAPD